MGAPVHSLGQASVGCAGYRGGSGFYAHDEVQVHRSGKSAPEEEEGEEGEGEEGEPGPP